MSILIAIPGTVRSQITKENRKEYKSCIEGVSNADRVKHTELGIAFARDGRIQRLVGFKDSDAIIDVLLYAKYDGAIAYFNTPDNEFPFKEFSPVLINKDYALATCGNALEVKGKAFKNRSNTSVFRDEVIAPCDKVAPDVVITDPFKLLMKGFLRKYVGMAVLEKSGKIHLYNNHVFRETYKNFPFANFQWAKNLYGPKPTTPINNHSYCA
jgi:hypothetical protein